MPLKYYNQPPYYDDFDQTKNYVRVLFRPGYAVQARELTQLQTAIQAQIERLGNHFFKEGTTVLGGETLLDTKYAYVKLEETFQYPDSSGGTVYFPEGDGGSNLAYYSTAVGCDITGATSGITAKVAEVIPSTQTDPLTLYVNYTSAGTNNTDHFFAAGEILSYTDANSVVRYFKVLSSGSPTGYGSRVSVTEGVYFISGNFVYAPAESIILEKYSNVPSARVVYKITETIVSVAEDGTLADNSLGTPNSSAPGANRYQIYLDLVTQPLADGERTETDIIQLLIVKSGLITGKARTEYTEIAKTLATRTYEESGNYTVKPFKIAIREYLRTGTTTTNNGVYTVSQVMAMQDLSEPAATTYGENRLAVCLEPSVAYVNGFRVQTLDVTYVPVEKARDTAYLNAAAIYCPLGGYINIENLVSLPDITRYSQISLKSGSGLTTVGTARARGLMRDGSYYRLYLFDVQMNSGHTFSEVTKVVDTTVDGYDFSADIVIDPAVGYAQLLDTSTSSLLFTLPVNTASTLREIGNTVGFTYSVRRKFSSTITTNQAQISVSAGETFDSSTYTDYVCVNSATGAVLPVTGISGVGTNTITLTFATASASIYVIAPTTRVLQEKTKTLVTNASKSISNPNTVLGEYDSLGKSDILRINNIYMSANFNTAATVSDVDIRSRYELDNGQRENFYDIGRIRLKPGSSKPTGQLLIKFDHFTHGGSGDYFSVDSYVLGANISLEEIPSFDSIKGKIYLGDAIDFRPTKGESGTFAASDTNEDVANTIVPGNVIRTDITHYLPRIDTVYVNKNGQFGVQKGVSAMDPRPPADPVDSMILYTIRLNAYTFGASDLSSTMVENRRYTMRDIGRLEKRLANVEYYTSLSLLEQDTAGKMIFDDMMNLRYQNAFCVDPFAGHNIGAADHPDYHCSMDTYKGICRPEFAQDYVNLVLNSAASTGVRKTGSLITLDYNEVTMIEQPYASDAEDINPHEIVRWKGNIQLSPPGDDWMETTYAPIIAPTVAAWEWAYWGDFSGTNPDLGRVVDVASYRDDAGWRGWAKIWNGWQAQWYGIDEELGGYINSRVGSQLSRAEIETHTGQFEWTGSSWIKTSSPTTVHYNDVIVDTSLVPYIRSKKIYFRATGMKPNSRVYAFFDGINVADFVRPLGSGESFVDYSSNPDDTSYLDAVQHPDGPDILVTDANGKIEGTFVIPNNSAIRFSSGTRIFRLIDNTLNDTDSAYTYADAQYHAVGYIETHAPGYAEVNVISCEPPAYVFETPPYPKPVVPVTPAAPYISLTVQGQTPKFIQIPFNLVAEASGQGIVKLAIFERSNYIPEYPNNWVQIAESTYNGATSATLIGRMYNNTLQGYYQLRAVVTLSDGSQYESNYIERYFSLVPPELVGVPNDGSSTFYHPY